MEKYFIKKNSWKTKIGTEVFRVLSRGSNAFLILNGNNSILVDTGKKSAFGRLSRGLEKLNITIEKISTLILTHTHYDHCQSTRKIKEISNCKVIISSAAEKSVIDGYTRIPDGTLYITKPIARLGRLIGKRKFGFEPFQPDILVEKEYELNIEDCKIKIIETAGHSTDSVSILVDDEIAIVGDTLLGVYKNSVFPPFTDDTEKMIESWGKLLNTECKIFLPGHGREISRDLLEKEFKRYSRKSH